MRPMFVCVLLTHRVRHALKSGNHHLSALSFTSWNAPSDRLPGNKPASFLLSRMTTSSSVISLSSLCAEMFGLSEFI